MTQMKSLGRGANLNDDSHAAGEVDTSTPLCETGIIVVTPCFFVRGWVINPTQQSTTIRCGGDDYLPPKKRLVECMHE